MKHKGVVTGATGYIGSHLVKELLDNDWDVYAIVRDGSKCENLLSISDKINIFEYNGNVERMSCFFKKIHPEVVFHLAAAVKNDSQLGDAKDIIKGNIEFGTDILEAMRYADIKQIINTGTYWQNLDTDAYNPVNLYAATKEAFEHILEYYVKAWNFKVITLRLYDVYGEDDVRPKLLTILKNSSNLDNIINITPAEQYLDMVHVTDVCKAYIKAFAWMSSHENLRKEIYGVYTGHEYMLKDVIAIFEKVLNRKLPIKIGGKPYKNREIMKPSKNYNCVPGWKADIELEQGLALFNKRGGGKITP